MVGPPVVKQVHYQRPLCATADCRQGIRNAVGFVRRILTTGADQLIHDPVHHVRVIDLPRTLHGTHRQRTLVCVAVSQVVDQPRQLQWIQWRRRLVTVPVTEVEAHAAGPFMAEHENFPPRVRICMDLPEQVAQAV